MRFFSTVNEDEINIVIENSLYLLSSQTYEQISYNINNISNVVFKSQNILNLENNQNLIWKPKRKNIQIKNKFLKEKVC